MIASITNVPSKTRRGEEEKMRKREKERDETIKRGVGMRRRRMDAGVDYRPVRAVA